MRPIGVGARGTSLVIAAAPPAVELVPLLGIAVAVYLVAGAVKGLIGIGLPTTAIGLMAQFVDAREAVALAIVPMVLANAWQLSRGGPPRVVLGRVLGRYRTLAACMLAGIALVSIAAPEVPAALVTLVLGAVMVAFAIASLLREPPPLPDRLDVPAQWLAGSVAGGLGGLTGVWAPPIIVYLGARRLAPDAFVETVGVLLFAGSVVLLGGYVANGLVDGALALRSLALTVPALVGFAVGERLRARVPAAAFRRLLLVFFLLMGLNLVRRALGGGV